MARRSYPVTDVRARKKYARAFNSTLIKIWAERIEKLGAIDTGRLRYSLLATRFKINDEASVMEFALEFVYYGIYVDAGTGRETPIGNPGDIGRAKRRVRKPWFSPKFYRSYKNISEFISESFGRQAVAVITSGLDDAALRNSIR